jgi:hypothetical protein
MVVKDPETGRVWLLKPGSSGTGPSAGADEDPSGPSQREAAFYQVAKEVGLWEFYPRCELLQLDDKMFAAMTLLPWSFKTAEKRRKTEPNVIRAILHPYLNNGDVHKWAALDAILGNNDSHGENVMVDDEGNVRMIDHGSAFAGPSFDPAHDKNAFVPYCLRAWGPEAFNTLPPEQKAKYLPRVGRQVADKLHSWLTSINPNVLAATLTRYGINQAPSLDRLAKLKNMATEMPVDEAVNRFWVTV